MWKIRFKVDFCEGSALRSLIFGKGLFSDPIFFWMNPCFFYLLPFRMWSLGIGWHKVLCHEILYYLLRHDSGKDRLKKDLLIFATYIKPFNVLWCYLTLSYKTFSIAFVILILVWSICACRNSSSLWIVNKSSELVL